MKLKIKLLSGFAISLIFGLIATLLFFRIWTNFRESITAIKDRITPSLIVLERIELYSSRIREEDLSYACIQKHQHEYVGLLSEGFEEFNSMRDRWILGYSNIKN